MPRMERAPTASGGGEGCEPLTYDPAEREIDEQTVSAARRGDGEAFVRMLKHYDGRLRALAFRVLRDPVLMDDALQDASIKAYQALRSFRGDSEVGTWLYRITYTTCLDYLRRERRFQLLTSADALDGLSCDDDPCDLVTRWTELEEWVRTSYTMVAPKKLARIVLEEDGAAEG